MTAGSGRLMLTACATAVVAIGAVGQSQSTLDSHNRALLRGQQRPGPAVSLAVDTEGLYRVSHSDLRAVGFPVDSVDPRRLHVTVQGEPVAVHVAGESDGRFDPEDYLLFYGAGFDGARLASIFNDAMARPGSVDNWLWQCRGTCDLAGVFEKYTTTNLYWLESADSPGLRMGTFGMQAPGGQSIQSSVSSVWRHAPSRMWWSFAPSEDTWFWDWISGTFTPAADGGLPAPMERTYQIDVPHVVGGTTPVDVAVGFASVADAPGSPDYHVWVGLNGQELGTLTWEGAVPVQHSWRVPGNQLASGANALTLRVLPSLPNGRAVAQRSPDLYLDWLEVRYRKRLVADGQRLQASVAGARTRPVELSGFDASPIDVYDLKDTRRPIRLTGMRRRVTPEGDVLRVATVDDAPRDILAVGPEAVRTPVVVAHEAVRLPPSGDYVIVAPQAFHAALAPLIRHREAQGLRVVVVNPSDLYRTFTYGIPHPIAVKSFLAHAFTTWPSPPRYLLLVGSGHWNLHASPRYKAPPVWMPPNLALVDPWQGEVDSANLLATLVGEDAVPDVATGRLPAASPEEVAGYVAKVLAYEGAADAPWMRRALWLADNVPDPGGDFEGSINAASAAFSALRPGLMSRVLTLNAFGCRSAGTDACRQVTDTLFGSLRDEGAVLLGFAGHASIDSWTNERVLRLADLDRLQTAGRWPFLLSLTCLDGYWIHPERESLVRRLLVSPDGVVGAFSPTGLGLTYGHGFLADGFIEALRGGPRDVGALVRAAKQRLHQAGTRPDLLHTYTIFGDPALRLALR